MKEEEKYHKGRWAGSEEEYAYLPDDRKEFKKERKQAVRSDRSKYKKSDRDKQKSDLPLSGSALSGRVISLHPGGVSVDCEGKEYFCTLKGSLKKEEKKLKSLVAIGDFVLVETCGEKEGIVAKILPRKSVLSRADHLHRRKEQLIAANIDQVFVTVSIGRPSLKTALVDRYLIAAEKGGMQPVIVINKIDLLQDRPGVHPMDLGQERMLFDTFCKDYRLAGYEVYPVSVVTQEGLDALKEKMQGKTSVFSGQSGVGKSSLLNAMLGLCLPVGQIIEKTQKGSHTTTNAHLIRLAGGGFCVDTPGIRSFGIWGLYRGETLSFFPEIHKLGQDCRFPACKHISEPDCAVLQALTRNELSRLRYDSYKKLLEEEQDDWTP